MLKPKVTLRGLVTKEFMRLYRTTNYHLFTCNMLMAGLRQLGYKKGDIIEFRYRYVNSLKLKYGTNFSEHVFIQAPPPKERLQNLLDFIKSEGL